MQGAEEESVRTVEEAVGARSVGQAVREVPAAVGKVEALRGARCPLTGPSGAVRSAAEEPGQERPSWANHPSFG